MTSRSAACAYPDAPTRLVLPRLIAFFLFAAFATPTFAQYRPPITGIALVHIYATDLTRSRAFYGSTLGLSTGDAGCLARTMPCFTINSQQRLELTQVTGGAPDDLLQEIAFATPDVSAMHDFLIAKKVSVDAIVKDSSGAQHFSLLDPEGHPIAFLQQPANSFFTAKAEQTSVRLLHAGFIVKDRAVEDHFYRDVLGFKLYWSGGFKDGTLNWVDMQVPDGTDWVEYMLDIPRNADKQERGVQNHIALGVVKIKPAFDRVIANGSKSDEKPQLGLDGKWQLNLYDPDQTRVEFMELTPTKTPCCSPYTGPHPKP